MPECIGYASNMYMHIQAYPSMSAHMCISVHAIPAQIWMSIGYCMTISCRLCMDEHLRKTKFRI